MPQIAARVVVMVSPWRSAPVFSAVPVTHGRHFIAELWTVMTAGWTRTPRRDIGRITEIGYGSFRASPDSWAQAVSWVRVLNPSLVRM